MSRFVGPVIGLKGPRSGGVIPNYFCSSKCQHCLYRCSPKWKRDYMNREQAKRTFEFIKARGNPSVHIGGGEVFLSPEDLFVVLEEAQKAGVEIEYVETNSSWYKNLETATKIMQKLQSLDVDTLLISMSPFHNERIAFEKVMGLVEACQDVGMSIFPWVAEFFEELSEVDPSKPHSFEEIEKIRGTDYVKSIKDRYWLHPGGRALDYLREVADDEPAFKHRSLETILEDPAVTRGCRRELESTNHYHIDLFGKYIPGGLCSGLGVDIEDLSVVDGVGGEGEESSRLSFEKYPLLCILASEGVKGLYDFAVKEKGYKPSKTEFIHKCDLCDDARKFLFLQSTKEGEEHRYSELTPPQFYSLRD